MSSTLRRVGEFAHGDVVDARLADDASRLDRQTATRLDHHARIHFVAHGHRLAHQVGAEVVDQDLVGTRFDGGA